MDDEHEGKVVTPAPPVAVRDRLASHRGVQLSPIAIESSYASKHRVNTANSWLFVPSQPEPEAIAQRCLDVLYQVALVAAGDEGVGGGSGGRVSNLSGQRSDKVYTPPARIFQTLASPRVVAVVALVSADVERHFLSNLAVSFAVRYADAEGQVPQCSGNCSFAARNVISLVSGYFS